MIADAIRITTIVGSIVSVIAFLLMMSVEWRRMTGTGQRLRYWALLCYAITTTYASAEGLAAGFPFGSQHVISMFTTIFALLAASYAYREIRQERHDRED